MCKCDFWLFRILLKIAGIVPLRLRLLNCYRQACEGWEAESREKHVQPRAYKLIREQNAAFDVKSYLLLITIINIGTPYLLSRNKSMLSLLTDLVE